MDGLFVATGDGPDGGFEVGESQLRERFSHSSGPGGQGVNTSSSRVELSLDVASCPDIPQHYRARLLAALTRRLVDGVLTVSASEFREQLANRRAARERMAALLARAARPVRTRRRTRPTRASRRRRLEAKSRRSELKRNRRAPRDW